MQTIRTKYTTQRRDEYRVDGLTVDSKWPSVWQLLPEDENPEKPFLSEICFVSSAGEKAIQDAQQRIIARHLRWTRMVFQVLLVAFLFLLLLGLTIVFAHYATLRDSVGVSR